MRKSIFPLFLSALLTVTGGSVAAQDFSSTESYVMMSAFKSFTNICLQDNRSSVLSSGFTLSYADYDSTVSAQRWRLLPASDASDSTLYYIQNQKTHYYVSGAFEAKGNYYTPLRVLSRSASKPWNITRQSNGYYLISAVDAYGVRYYLHATDTTAISLPNFRSEKLEMRKTRFTWDIQNYAVLNGVKEVKPTDNGMGVSVIGGSISVYGTRDYHVYTLDGRELSPSATLRRGIYLVCLPRRTLKVSVR